MTLVYFFIEEALKVVYNLLLLCLKPDFQINFCSSHTEFWQQYSIFNFACILFVHMHSYISH